MSPEDGAFSGCKIHADAVNTHTLNIHHHCSDVPLVSNPTAVGDGTWQRLEPR